MKKILYISQKDRTKELKNFSSYFIATGNEYHSINLDNFKGDLLEFVTILKPTHILIHHNRALLEVDFWIKLSKLTKLIWWVNDERYPLPDWIKGLVGIIDLWLVASKDTSAEIKKLGGKAEYLIMGFNKKKPSGGRNVNLVFTGQNSGEIFPLSLYRSEIVRGMKHRVKDNFEIYGKGWDCSTKDCIGSGIYSHAKIGLSVGHYNTNSTYSNRVLQIMSNGALCLMHETKGIKEVFGDNVVYFNGVKDCFQKYLRYISNDSERLAIAKKGKYFVDNNFTWEHKAKNILLWL